MTNIFTEVGDLINADIILPIENFFKNDVEPAGKAALVDLEHVGATFLSQFEKGLGADAFAAAMALVNGAASLTSLGGVIGLATTIGEQLLKAAEASAEAAAPAAIASAQNVILNAARTVYTAAVINASSSPNPVSSGTSNPATSGTNNAAT